MTKTAPNSQRPHFKCIQGAAENFSGVLLSSQSALQSSAALLRLIHMRSPFIFAAIVLLGVATDLASKWYVFSHLNPGESYAIIAGVLHFTAAKNHGVAFSMGSGYPGLILLVAIVAIVALGTLYWRSRKSGSPVLLAALGLILIGAIGNLHDRIAFSYVRDFIDFVPPIPLIGHWAVFNVADICITCGVILYLFCAWFIEPAPGAKPATPAA